VGSVEFLNIFINQLSQETRGRELNFMRPLGEEETIGLEHE
jgi:hypothetical protein